MVRGVSVERHSLVPLDGRADNLDERQGNLGVPLLRRLEDEVVERLADLCERKRRVSELLGLSVCSGEHLRPLTGVLAVICVRKMECHRVVLRVVAELLRDGGIAEEEGEVGENVLTGGRNGAGSGEVPGTLLILGLHLFCLVVTGGLFCVLLFGGSFRPTARLASVCPALTCEWNEGHILDSG